MTREDINNIISAICPNDEDFEKPIISPKYLKTELEQLALEQEPCEDCISRQAVLKQLKGCLTGGETEYEYVKLHIDSIPSAYKGMTNGEVLETIFPNAECNFEKFCKGDTVVFDLNGFYMRVSAEWWNSPYLEGSDKE